MFRNLNFDVFGRRSKKEILRERLDENKRRGEAAEDLYESDAALRGVDFKKVHKGCDYIETERDFFGMVIKRTNVEVKSSSKAKLSKLQKKMKRKLGKKYIVDRYDPVFY